MSKFFTYGWIAVLLVSLGVVLWLKAGLSGGGNMLGVDQEPGLVIRTDFSNDALYESVCEVISKPQDGFPVNIQCVSEQKYDGLSLEQVAALIDTDKRTFVFVIDQTTLSQSEKPVLAVDLAAHPYRMFRVLPSLVAGVESNLSTSNMGFEEFMEIVDSDGVVRDVM